jgi:hypothetical protein
MPYLQLDVCSAFSAGDKKHLAKNLCGHDVGRHSPDQRGYSRGGRRGIWCTVDGEPTPVSVLIACDIRKGRTPELRLTLAKQLVADCVNTLGLREDRLNVAFTQHSGDEMYHPTLGGYRPEWSADEGNTNADG